MKGMHLAKRKEEDRKDKEETKDEKEDDTKEDHMKEKETKEKVSAMGGFFFLFIPIHSPCSSYGGVILFSFY